MSIRELSGRERLRARQRRWAQEGPREAPVVIREPSRRLDHGLCDHLMRWAALSGRGALERDEGYRRHRAEVRALLHGFAWDVGSATATRCVRPGRLRVGCWNIERGKRWDTLRGVLRENPQMQDLDLLLLTEVDLGMGRSGNRDVARDLAHELGMGFAFATSHLVLAPGDSAERDHGLPNAQSLHGVAVLSRFPISRVCGVGLPEFADKLGAVERRLGAKRALMVELRTPGAPLSVAVVHLDPFCPPRHRAWQMRRLVEALPRLSSRHILVGGDFNTNTYDLGSPAGLARDVCHKLLRLGFAGTVANYMIPHVQAERSIFDVLEEVGLRTEGFIDEQTGTLRYDLNDLEYLDKTRRTLPRPMSEWLLRRLEPWGGSVPMRLDWFAGRGVEAEAAWTVDRPRYLGQHVSDHDPIGVELRWPPRAQDGARTG